MLDSTACIDYLRGNMNLKSIILQKDPFLSITTITQYEIMIGILNAKRKRSRDFYKNLLQKWVEFQSSLKIFPVNLKDAEMAAMIYDELEIKGKIIDDNDILIAGIMRANDITQIATKNKKHFENIDQIQIIEY